MNYKFTMNNFHSPREVAQPCIMLLEDMSLNPLFGLPVVQSLEELVVYYNEKTDRLPTNPTLEVFFSLLASEEEEVAEDDDEWSDDEDWDDDDEWEDEFDDEEFDEIDEEDWAEEDFDEDWDDDVEEDDAVEDVDDEF